MTRQQIYDSLVELACTTLPKINKAELKKMLSIQVRCPAPAIRRKGFDLSLKCGLKRPTRVLLSRLPDERRGKAGRFGAHAGSEVVRAVVIELALELSGNVGGQH